MSRVYRVAVIALALCWVLPATARAQNGTIAGLLVEDGTGIPLFGIPPVYTVTAFNTTTGDTTGVSDNTDIDGRYEISVPPGSYYVKVTFGSFHVRELHPNIMCIAEDCPLTIGTPVTVTSGTTSTVNFSLAKEGIITGTVRRAGDNTPQGSVTVDLYNASTSFVGSWPTDLLTGAFTINGLAAGTYFARTRPSTVAADLIPELYGGVPCPRAVPDSDCRIASGTPIVVSSGATTANVDFSLDVGAAISGTVVTDGNNVAIANIVVGAYLGDILVASATTGQTGLYTITGLPAGRYRVRTAATSNLINEWQNGVCVGCAGSTPTITLTTGQAVTGVNFSLSPGGSISGTVACNTPTLDQRGPDMLLFDARGKLVQQLTRSLLTLNACRGGSPMTYTFTGLPDGSYYVLAKDQPAQPGGTQLNSGLFVDQLYGGIVCVTADCDVRRGAPVVIASGVNVNGVDITLQPGGQLVPIAQAGDPVFVDNPLYKVYDVRGVELVDVAGPSQIGQAHWILSGLPPGTYYITKNGRLNGGIDCLDCPPTAGQPIIVNADTSVTGQTSFNTPSRSVSGTITNAAGGALLSTIDVELVSGSGKVIGSALSNMMGLYTITGLQAGTYFARTVNDRGFVDEVYMDAACGTCDPRAGTAIVVSSSTDVTGIDFVLAEGGVVSGLVSDTAGVVLGSVPVSLFAGTTTFTGVKSSSASGRYRATVSAGSYRALAEATSTNGAEIYSELPCTSAGCDPSTGTAIPVTTSTITDNINFTLSSCSAMTISPSLLATGVNGTTYRQVLSATGGTGPYVFDVTDGVLPLGLTLNGTTGVLQGSPSAAGRSTFRVSAIDATGCATDRSYVLDVQACAFTLSPQSQTVAAEGGNIVITIANGCGSQEVVESSDWISVQSNTPGQVILTVSANTGNSSRITSVAIGRRAFEVRQAGASSLAPYGLLEIPTEGAQVSGAVAIGGWALDDVEVLQVRIYRDPVAGEPVGVVYIGTAVFIPGARPDVQLAAPGVPGNDRAGFGFLMLTNTLPNQGNGTFRIHAVADDAEGHQTLLGSRTIVSNNAAAELPFGTIDTPLQGGTVSGSSYVNFGWALTPRPAMIPTDGSTIEVIVDGVPIGTVDYNHFRPDVSSVFPDLANSGGPVGFRTFDTTALGEGLHTISWTVTDSRPATAGLGSRYFNVANSADAPPPSASVTTTETTQASEQASEDVAKPLGAAPAPDLGRRAESVAVEANDEQLRARTLTLAAMERTEIALDSLLDSAVVDEACPGTWAGYLSKDNVLTDLPVGAALDPTGTFYWQTGPGFAGRFLLVFVRTNCRGEKQQVRLAVTIPIGKSEQR